MADVEILYDPITVNSGPIGVAVTGLDNIKVDSKLAVTQPIETKSALTLSVPDTVKNDAKLTLSVPDTVKTDSKLTFEVPEPIKTESKAAIDLQPVVVDQCLRLSLGPLPPTLVCLPNRQRLGVTLFGLEVFGLTLDGEARIVVGDLPKPPHVIAAPALHPAHARDAGHGQGADQRDEAPRRAASAADGRPPFVIRLGG